MHKIIPALAAGFAIALFTSTAGATDVGVSVHIGQPGFYGRIDFGNTAPPAVVLREPIWVQRQPVRVEPVYMRIPPGHQKNWGKHCARYNACGVPVYFVREDWYEQRYAGHEHGDNQGHGKDKHKDKGKDKSKDKDHGHGKGKDRD